MPQMLLLNPAKRRRAKRSTGKRRTAAQKRATAKMLAANRARRGRSANPARRRGAYTRVRTNPIGRRIARRRRNPISLGGLMSGGRGYVSMFKDALITGGGAVAVDVAFGQVQKFLPASLTRTPGTVGLGDAVKAIFTVAVGKLLSKPTRGLSQKAAAGALTVQAHQIIASMVPATLALGYAVPGRTANMQARVGPNARLGKFVAPGTTPLLSSYPASGAVASPLLNGSRQSAMAREGFAHIR